jgi:hypothetical protein
MIRKGILNAAIKSNILYYSGESFVLALDWFGILERLKYLNSRRTSSHRDVLYEAWKNYRVILSMETFWGQSIQSMPKENMMLTEQLKWCSISIDLFLAIVVEVDSGCVLAQEVYMKIFHPPWTHRSFNLSTGDSLKSTNSSRHRFRKQLSRLHHQNQKMNMLKCEISENEYPAKYVVAGHIFKKSFGSTHLRHLLNLSDINDPGNGILMFVSIEYHFDRGNMCLPRSFALDRILSD